MPTIANLPVGKKLKFGAYSVNGEPPHKVCWVKTHHDNTLLTEFIEDQCIFDVKEPENPERFRKEYGNNRYSLSNIHQYLNADGYEWFQPTHNYDQAPEDALAYNNRGYVHKPGFLHFFKEWEIEAIEDSEVKIVLPHCDFDGDTACDTIFAKCFLPSVTNMGRGDEGGIYEGEIWDLFSSDGDRTCTFSHELFITGHIPDKPRDETKPWYYLLRTPKASNAYCIRLMDTSGELTYSYSSHDYTGIRPALKLNPNTLISEEPDEDGYYEVLCAPQEITEINEEDFLVVLKKT